MQQLPSVAGFSQSFTEPGGFAEALQGGSFDYLPLPGQRFDAKLQVLSLGGLLLQVAHMGSHAARGAMMPGLSVVILQLPSRIAPVRMNGTVTGRGDAYFTPGGLEFHGHCESDVSWVALALPDEKLAALAEFAPLPLRHAGLSGVLALPNGPMERLTGAAAAAARMTEDLPDALFEPGCAEGLAQSMQELLTETLTAGSRFLPVTRATREAHRVVRAADEYLHANMARPIYRGQLCAALGVSLRKLHDAFIATTGMSPHTYLKTRRLMLARAALRRSGGEPALVKSVALSHGFWHFGHFGRDYRRQFGESPSQTRSAGPVPAIPWLRGVVAKP